MLKQFGVGEKSLNKSSKRHHLVVNAKLAVDAIKLKKKPELEAILLDTISIHTAGEPTGEGKWLNCRLHNIQEQLQELGYQVSKPVISRLLKKHDYSLRVNAKHKSSKQHSDRDNQFKHIQIQRQKHQKAKEPVISVDTKKKELVGDFKNNGRIWCQQAEEVNLYDFPSDSKGKAVPYGIYDLVHNCGTVYVG